MASTTEKPIFMRMAEVASFSQMNAEQQQIYMRSLNRYRTFLATKDYDYNPGREDAYFAIADKMLAKGMPLETVAEMTGLSPEELKSRLCPKH